MAKSHAPRHAAPRGVKSGDLREAIENAFHAVGGRDYLVGVAKRRPDIFCMLLGKIIPSEVHMNVLAAYQAMPIPVEAREAIPALIASQAPTEGETLGRTPQPLEICGDDSWC